MDLEERIRTAIKHGNLLSVSLYKLVSKKDMWCATYLNADNNKREMVEHPDPITALEKAIKPLRSKPPKDVVIPAARQVRKKPTRDEDLI